MNLWTSLSLIAGCLVNFIMTVFFDIPKLNANSVDPDQTSRLSMLILLDARHDRVD